MNASPENEEKFDEATEELEEIAAEAEQEREGHGVDQFVVPEGQHMIPPLTGPHHTPVE